MSFYASTNDLEEELWHMFKYINSQPNKSANFQSLMIWFFKVNLNQILKSLNHNVRLFKKRLNQ